MEKKQFNQFKPLKIISLYPNQRQTIKKAVHGNRQAQEILFNALAPKMLGLCRQYIKDLHFAEDVMIQGFVKVFEKLDGYRHEGSFEGWVRRIMVRCCIDHLRKRQFVVLEGEIDQGVLDGSDPDQGLLDVEEVQQLIDSLPEGYRTVFLLHAIEGHPHQEIAELLDISEGTSKSQLSKARKMLRDQLKLKGISPNRSLGK